MPIKKTAKKTVKKAVKKKPAVRQKAAAKSAVKKQTPKKPAKALKVTIKKSQKPLAKAYGEACFWINFGPIVSSLDELESALREISDEQFFHHVNMDRNDFSRWIQEVLEDDYFAREFSSVFDRNIAADMIREYLK